MSTELYLALVFYLIFMCVRPVNSADSSGSQEVLTGHDATLQCPNPPENSTIFRVEWTLDGKDVLVVRDGKVISQEEKFKDRASIPSGTSLKLANITKQDEGIYICNVRYKDIHQKEECKVSLVVRGVVSNNETFTSPSPVHGRTIGIAVGAFVIIAIAILTIVCMRRKQGKAIEEPNNQDTTYQLVELKVDRKPDDNV